MWFHVCAALGLFVWSALGVLLPWQLNVQPETTSKAEDAGEESDALMDRDGAKPHDDADDGHEHAHAGHAHAHAAHAHAHAAAGLTHAHGRSSGDRILAYSSFLTGGVFLGVGLIHMLPDAIAQQNTLHGKASGDAPSSSSSSLFAATDFPFAFVTACVGFLCIWAIEKINFSDSQIQNEQLLSIATNAAENRGASICYMSVSPVTTYGTFHDEPSPLLAAAAEPHSHEHAHAHAHTHAHAHAHNGDSCCTDPALPALHEHHAHEHHSHDHHSHDHHTHDHHAHEHANGRSHSRAPTRCSTSTSSSSTSLIEKHVHKEAPHVHRMPMTIATSYHHVNSSGSNSSSNTAPSSAVPLSAGKVPRASNSAAAVGARAVVGAGGESSAAAAVAAAGGAGSRPRSSSHVRAPPPHRVSDSSASIAFAPFKTVNVNDVDGGPNSSASAASSLSLEACDATMPHPSQPDVHSIAIADLVSGVPFVPVRVSYAPDSSSPPLSASSSCSSMPPLLNDEPAGASSSLASASALPSSSSAPSSSSSSSCGPDSLLHAHAHEDVHHHHIVISGDSSMLPVVLALVFSVHSVMEGLALGVQSSLNAGAVGLLIAVASHKLIESMSVASNFVKERVRVQNAWPVLLVYCCMTPVGILLGLALQHVLVASSTTAVMVISEVQAFAAGSFIYLAVHELSDDRCCEIVQGSHQVALALSGVLSMAVLALWV